MKYAVHYYKSFRYFDQVDEVVFNYKGTEYITEFIPKFLKPEQRAIINVSNLDIEEIFEYLLVLKQKHDNYVIQLDWFSQLDWIPALEENDIPYMFFNYAVNMDQVYCFTQYNITDIYICESLGFKIRDLQKLRSDKGINIRVFPDIAQSSFGGKIPDIIKFFIRPEGLDAYEKFVDVIELYHCDSRLSVVYEIYKQRQWTGYLEDLILSFSENFSLDNTTILPSFDITRIGCGKTCAIDKCHFCFRCLELSPLLEENELAIIREKDPLITEEEQKKILQRYEDINNELKSPINQENMQFER